MIRVVQLLSIAIALSAISEIRAQAIHRNIVEGAVMKSHSNEPVSNASVELKPVLEPQSYVVQSGSDGRFQFRNIPDGEYELSATRSGFVRAEFGKRRQSDPPLHVSVNASGASSNLTLSMVPSAVVVGNVSSSGGEPSAAVIVRALRLTYRDGVPALRVEQTVVTDDQGNYRLFSLMPGRYYVSASLPANSAVSASYYQSTSSIQLARVIDVAAGSTIGGINIASHFENGITVRGKVSFTGSAASVELEPRLPMIPAAIASSVTVDRNTGAFSIPNVFPGEYFLNAQSDGYSIRIPLEIGSATVPEIQVTIPRPVHFATNIKFESNLSNPPAISFRIHAGTPSVEEFMALNGGLPTLSLIPGDYQITPWTDPTKAYPQSMRLGNLDVLNDGLHVDPSSEGTIELVMGTHPGNLQGNVISATGQPEPNTIVVLLPDAAHRNRVDLFKDVRTDIQGRFKVEAVPPGDYVVLSWEDIEPTAWKNAEFMKDYEKFGKPIHVDADGRNTIQVEAIPSR